MLQLRLVLLPRSSLHRRLWCRWQYRPQVVEARQLPLHLVLLRCHIIVQLRPLPGSCILVPLCSIGAHCLLLYFFHVLPLLSCHARLKQGHALSVADHNQRLALVAQEPCVLLGREVRPAPHQLAVRFQRLPPLPLGVIPAQLFFGGMIGLSKLDMVERIVGIRDICCPWHLQPRGGTAPPAAAAPTSTLAAAPPATSPPSACCYACCACCCLCSLFLLLPLLQLLAESLPAFLPNVFQGSFYGRLLRRYSGSPLLLSPLFFAAR